MKHNFTIEQRNRIVEDHLHCIDEVIGKNSALMKAAHLDRDDVYQQLALRLIRCVEGFDPDKGKLEVHIYSQLQYELLNCKSSQSRYGFTNAPYDLWGAVISLDDYREGELPRGELAAA